MNLRSFLFSLCLFCVSLSPLMATSPEITTVEKNQNLSLNQASLTSDTAVTPATVLKTDLKEAAKIAAKYAGIYAAFGTLYGAHIGRIIGLEKCSNLASNGSASMVAGSMAGGALAIAGLYAWHSLPYGILTGVASRVQPKNKLTAKDIAKPVVLGIGVSALAKMLTDHRKLPFSLAACVTLGCIAYQRLYEPKTKLELTNTTLEKTEAVTETKQTTDIE